MKKSVLGIIVFVFSSLTGFTGAFSVDSSDTRRSFLSGIAAASFGVALGTAAAPASAEFRLGDPKSVVGREIRSFNALINEFKNTALDGGLDGSQINEPSISFIEFGEKMKAGEVKEVEFMAPSGQVAYATLKGKKKVRIGAGYPTGGRNSWSSPDYVIRSVSNFGVPYKFTVPALAKFKS